LSYKTISRGFSPGFFISKNQGREAKDMAEGVMRTFKNLLEIKSPVKPEVMTIGNQDLYIFTVAIIKNDAYLENVFFSYEIRIIIRFFMTLSDTVLYWKDDYPRLEEDPIQPFFEVSSDHFLILIA
jgi:hypothetical protein